MSEEDGKAPHHTTLKSFDKDPKPQLPTKFVYVGDMKVSAKGGFFVWRHVDQSEERSHGRVHLSQSRCWRDSAVASRDWQSAERVELSSLSWSDVNDQNGRLI